MSNPISLRLAVAVLIAAPIFPLTALGQSQASPSQSSQSQGSQTESVADAARRAREQKKAAAKQPVPVITDDTLKPSAPAPAAQEANAPASASSAQPSADSSSVPASDKASNPDAAPAAAANAADAAEAAKDSPEVATLKQQVADEQKGLDLLQRELALEQDNVYSKTNQASDTAGKAKLDALLAQISDKQQSVDSVKARLATLLDSLGVSAPATPEAPAAPVTKPPQS